VTPGSRRRRANIDFTLIGKFFKFFI